VASSGAALTAPDGRSGHERRMRAVPVGRALKRVANWNATGIPAREA
jgi:hypothetical protein